MGATIDFKDKRRFPRFRVEGLDFLRTQIDRRRAAEQIVTLSEGGCGFYGFNPNWPLNPAQRIFPRFEFVSGDLRIGPIEAQASIVYIKAVRIGGQDLVYYGMEFLPAHRERIRPLIERLEELKMTGHVKAA